MLRLKQFFQLATLVVFGFACTTTPEDKYRSEISGLTDMSLEYIETKWGKPEFNLPKTKGRLVKFTEVLVKEEEPVSGSIAKKLCIAELQLDKAGLVKDWNYTKCRDLNPVAKKQQKPVVEDAGVEQSDFDLDERKLPGVEGADDEDSNDKS